jgi:hypothetical protein
MDVVTITTATITIIATVKTVGKKMTAVQTNMTQTVVALDTTKMTITMMTPKQKAVTTGDKDMA